MRWTILMAVALMICLMPSAMGIMKTVDCLNNNTLRKYTNLTYCNATRDCTDYNLTEYVTCEYGCDAGRMMCVGYEGSPGTAIPLALFLVFELLGFGLLLWSFVAGDASIKLIASLISLIIMFSMGLLASNILVDGVAMRFDWLGWLNIGLAWVGVIMFLASMFFLAKRETKLNV